MRKRPTANACSSASSDEAPELNYCPQRRAAADVPLPTRSLSRAEATIVRFQPVPGRRVLAYSGIMGLGNGRSIVAIDSSLGVGGRTASRLYAGPLIASLIARRGRRAAPSATARVA